jgi:hypothetical protein
MRNIRKFILPALFVATLGISNFVTPVGATAQMPNALPSNAAIYKGKSEVMVWAEVGKVAYKVLDVASKLASIVRLFVAAGGEHPGSVPQLTDGALD